MLRTRCRAGVNPAQARSGPGTGVVDPAQARALWTRSSTGRGRLGAMLGEGWADPMQRQGAARVWHSDVTQVRRCENAGGAVEHGGALRVRAFARASCCVIAFP